MLKPLLFLPSLTPGTMIPESGGMYAYLHAAFGPLPAFLYVWVTAVVRNNAGGAVVALTFANYLLRAILDECEAIPEAAVRLIAALLICECRCLVTCIYINAHILQDSARS